MIVLLYAVGVIAGTFTLVLTTGGVLRLICAMAHAHAVRELKRGVEIKALRAAAEEVTRG